MKTTSVTRKTPPTIKPLRMPVDIVGDFEAKLHHLLAGWERNKNFMDWGGYVMKAKISPQDRTRMVRIMAECRENGFFAPFVDGNRVNWHQMVEPPDAVKTEHRRECRCKTCQKK